jgi:hypothetical protein
MQSPAAGNACTLNSVHCCVAWLNHAGAVLNPERVPHHSISFHEMRAFVHCTAPPPPLLQEQWSSQVWAMPGEPYEVYLLRCLARQSGITLLSPHFSPDAHRGELDELQVGDDTMSSLFFETCVVVGLRVEPFATNLLQVGWDTQPCPYCPIAIAAVSHDVAAACQPRSLPLLYGGDTCEYCSRALPLLPAWTRVMYLVLQRHDKTRSAAVAYGDGALRHLSLGATVHAMLYRSQTEQQEPLLVVHAARPTTVDPLTAPHSAVSCQNRTTSMSAGHGNLFRSFYDQIQSSFMAQRWGGVDSSRILDEVTRGFSPKLLGQVRTKKLVLLVVLHALYGVRHPSSDVARQPLDLLLLGPAKTGKSVLLRDVQLLMGSHADVLDSTVVRSAGKGERKRTGDGASFLLALPSRSRGLLMAGPALTATTLVLDRLPSSLTSAVASLQDALERRRGCVADVDGVEGSIVVAIDLAVQIIAAAEEENASSVQLAPFFSLVATLTPANSLGESALISQEVVAASRARASSSRSSSSPRSISASSSASRGLVSPSSSQRSASLRRSSDANTAAERLTADDVEYLLSRAADPTLLSTVMNATVCYTSYMPKLIAAAGLVDDAQPAACAFLPPPSACRGPHRIRACSASQVANEEAECLSESPLMLETHLRTLRCLSQARLLLESATHVRATGWTEEMCDEVWQLYVHHLVTLADLLHQRGGAEKRVVNGRTAAAAAAAQVMSTPASPGMGDASIRAPWTANVGTTRHGGGAPKKLSKRKIRLCFLDELRRCSHGNNVVLPASTECVFAQMGGSAAFGDPLDVVMGQLQGEGLMLRCLGGWRVL